MQKLVMATGNKGKLKEFQSLLAHKNFTLISQLELQVPEVDETGLSFVENAVLKARHACDITRLPALADDSGLVVPALNGAPGIYSSRYAGKDATDQQNIAKLISELTDVPQLQRKAYFYCVIVFLPYAKCPTPVIAEGRWDGVIAKTPQGDAGFGYDPIFWLPKIAKTAAQLELTEKNKISHRAQAMRQLLTQLETFNE